MVRNRRTESAHVRGRRCLSAGRLGPRHRTTHTTGRSSDLRLVTMFRRPSHNRCCSGSKPGPLAEYSSGPVPDSHRLPFSSPQHFCARNLSVHLRCINAITSCQVDAGFHGTLIPLKGVHLGRRGGNLLILLRSFPTISHDFTCFRKIRGAYLLIMDICTL
jgi:hypothetical protein